MNFGNFQMPTILTISPSAAGSLKERAMYAYALMHVKDVIGGDIEIKMRGSAPSKYISVQSMPSTFKKFWEQFSGAESFHCRVQFPCQKTGIPNRDLALVSKHYNEVYDMMLQGDSMLLHGGYLWSEKEAKDLFENEISSLAFLLKNGKPLPIKVFINPDAKDVQVHATLWKDRVGANGKIHVRERSKVDENRNYLCFRNNFNFFCTDDIPCCGKCPIMKKAYDLLVNEALDEESAKRLTEQVEKAELFAVEENGTYSCKHFGTCTDNSCKSHDAYIAAQEIRRYWSECYLPV